MRVLDEEEEEDEEGEEREEEDADGEMETDDLLLACGTIGSDIETESKGGAENSKTSRRVRYGHRYYTYELKPVMYSNHTDEEGRRRRQRETDDGKESERKARKAARRMVMNAGQWTAPRS